MATNIAEVEALRPLWHKVTATSPATIFQEFEWNLLAVRTFTNESPYFVAAESGSSVAIIPAVVRNGVFGLAGGPLFDYRDAICAGDPAAFAAALMRVAIVGFPLSISGILGKSSGARWSDLSPVPWTAAPCVSAAVNSAESFAMRHTRSRRALRRLKDLGAQVRKVQGTPPMLGCIYREKVQEPGGHGANVFVDGRCIDFMRAVASLAGTQCEVFLLEIGERAIAALVTFIDGAIRRFYTTWMHAEWGRHSPGIALLFEATRQTLEAGLDCDYMTGEQPYKLRFATGSEPLYRVEASAAELARLVRERSPEPFALKAA